MARMPGAVWQGEHGSRAMSHYDIVCVHTIVGYAPAHAAHFSVKGDGTILQSRDTRYQSAANLEGNHRVISIENEDHGPHFPSWSGSNVPALTPAQVVANGRILLWANQTHGVPLQLCPNSRPESRGLAYHRQGIDGNFSNGRVPGGEVWTKHRGKVCPGDRRIAQLPAILAAAAGTPTPLPPEEIDPMASILEWSAAEKEAFYQHIRVGVSRELKAQGSDGREAVKSAVREVLAESGIATGTDLKRLAQFTTNGSTNLLFNRDAAGNEWMVDAITNKVINDKLET